MLPEAEEGTAEPLGWFLHSLNMSPVLAGTPVCCTVLRILL